MLMYSQSWEILFFYFFNIYFWERETVRQKHKETEWGGGGAERQGDTESEVGSRLWAVNTESDVGLEHTNCEIMTWAEVGCSTNWAMQAPQEILFKVYLKLGLLKLIWYTLQMKINVGNLEKKTWWTRKRLQLREDKMGKTRAEKWEQTAKRIKQPFATAAPALWTNTNAPGQCKQHKKKQQPCLLKFPQWVFLSYFHPSPQDSHGFGFCLPPGPLRMILIWTWLKYLILTCLSYPPDMRGLRTLSL